MESRNPVRLVTPVHAENSEPLEEQISHKFTQNTDRVDFKVPMVEPADEELNEENEYGDYTEAKETEQEAALYQQIPHDGSEFEPTKDEYSSICGFENYSYLRKSQVWHCVEDIVMSYECIYDTDVRVITREQFWGVILHKKIPVTACLLAVMGLPCSGKTTAIEGMLKKFIKLKKESLWSFDDYMKRKKNDQCLSIYELCVLGGLPHDKYAWSFATNRYGAIYSIICSLARQYPSITEAKFELSKQEPGESFIDQHVQWLMAEVDKHLQKIKGETSKLSLIQDGISLINVMDVGVNKAIYDFLSIMLLSCKKHFRLAFFSLDRDALQLDQVPDLSHSRYERNNDCNIVMRERSRLSYLLHFGTLGYKKNDPDAIDACNTVMVAMSARSMSSHSDAVNIPEEDALTETKKAILKEAEKEGVDQFLKEWELVDLSDTGILKNQGETLQNIIKKIDQYKMELPLRWIILRSLVSSLNPQSANQPNSKAIIMHKNFIIKEAAHLNMNRKDVENFLIAFTEFGSILYMPQFEDIKHLVIVDIYEFAQLLDKLFYPPNSEAPYVKHLLEYGIISLQSIQALLGSNVVNSLMEILTSFVMVAKIKSEKSILIDDAPLQPGVYYYLPSAKSGDNYIPSKNDDKCAFLEVASVNFPANFQACVSQGLMNKNDDVFLCAIEYSNISQFEFKSKGSTSGVRIDLIYEGQKSRLVIRHDINASTFESIVDACTKVLYAFCHCLGKKANMIRDLRHEVTIPCGLEDKRHTLYFNKELEKCTCLEAIDQNSFRSCWVEAAKKCKELKHSADKIDGKSDRTGPKSIFEIGELFEKFDIDVSRLAEALKIKAPPDFNDKKKAVVFMLLTWEKDGKYDASLLENALKQIGMP